MSKKLITVLALILVAIPAVWQISERNEEILFPYVILFIVPAVILGWLHHRYRDTKFLLSGWPQTVFYLLLSAGVTAFVISNWDLPLFDDAGFLLRYLDNFAKGYFYSYNPQDGPVFGISSFSYGLLTGMLCMFQLVTPDQSIAVASAAGLFIICFMLLKILQQYGMNLMQLFISFLLIIFSSKFFLNSMTTGMETPVHMAIVLSAVYFFVKEKSSMMWLMLALSVISKLDAVPLAVTLGGIHLLQNRKNLIPVSWQNKTLREFILFAVVPIAVWVIFAFIVFGSPLPQSAYSKIHFHPREDDYWFPFIRYFVENDFRMPVFYLFLIVFIINAFLVVRRKCSVRTLAFGLGFFSTMILYYFYNPREQMTWYFAMPDFLLLAQTLVSLYFISEAFFIPSYRPYFYSILFAGAGLFLFSDTYYGRIWMQGYLDHTENERISIGKYLASITNEGDTLIAQHGHISRYTKAYVIDMTGLNSKLSTQYENDMYPVTRKFRPDFVISHGLEKFLNTMDSNNYVPVKSFYDICESGWPAWRIFKRKTDYENKIRLVVPADSLIKCYDRKWNFGIPVAVDKNVQIALPFDSAMKAISFGIKRKAHALEVQVALFSEWRLLTKQNFTVEAEGHDYKEASRYSKEIIFTLSDSVMHAPERKIEITAVSGEEIMVVEALYHVKQEDRNTPYAFQP